MVEEKAMVVDSERTSREFICFNMCYYNHHPEPKEQEPGKKKKKKRDLEPISVDEGRSEICRKVEAA